MSCAKLPYGFIWIRSSNPTCPGSIDLFSDGIHIASVKQLNGGWIAIVKARFAQGLTNSFCAGSAQKCMNWLQKWVATHFEELMATSDAEKEAGEQTHRQSGFGLASLSVPARSTACLE